MSLTNNFRLILKKDSLYVNSSGNVIGVIFFEIDGFYFPENNWYDFVVRLLSWLSESILNLKSKIEEDLDMPFMEGCYKVELALDKKELCKINFIEGEKLAGDKEIIHKSITVPLNDVIDEVTKACEMIIRMRESKELEFDLDYEELLEAYHSLVGHQSH